MYIHTHTIFEANNKYGSAWEMLRNGITTYNDAFDIYDQNGTPRPQQLIFISWKKQCNRGTFTSGISCPHFTLIAALVGFALWLRETFVHTIQLQR